jgi:hypothetical protein
MAFGLVVGRASYCGVYCGGGGLEATGLDDLYRAGT